MRGESEWQEATVLGLTLEGFVPKDQPLGGPSLWLTRPRIG